MQVTIYSFLNDLFVSDGKAGGATPPTTLRFGTLTAALPPRVQSAPPTLEEEKRKMTQKSTNEESRTLETAFEEEVMQFNQPAASSTGTLPSIQQVESIRPFVPGQQHPHYHPNQHYQQRPPRPYYPNVFPQQYYNQYRRPSMSHNVPYYGGPIGGYHPSPYFANTGVGMMRPQANYGGFNASSPLHPMHHQQPVGGPPSPSSSAQADPTTIGEASASSFSIPVITPPNPPTISPATSTLSRPIKKIAIVDPNTGKEVDLLNVPRIVKPESSISSSVASPQPTTVVKPHAIADGVGSTCAVLSSTNPTTLASTSSSITSVSASTLNITPVSLPITPRKNTVVISDPVSKKEVSLAELAASTQKDLTNILEEIDEDDLFKSDKSIVDSDLEYSSSEMDEDEEQEEEQLVEFPVIMTRKIRVNYPEEAVPFTFPAEGDPLRYSMDFLLQFAPHCKGEAKDIASVAFPKDLPTERRRRDDREERSGRRGGDRRDREREHRRGGRHEREKLHIRPEDTVLSNRAADAWKRASEMVLDEDKVLLRGIKELLNKLTEEKFEILSKQIIGAGVLKTSVSAPMINLFFDKAVEEPHYAPIYARLCYRIWQHDVDQIMKPAAEAVGEAVDPKKSLFRKSLVNKCQIEYDTKRAYSKSRMERLMAKQLAEANEDAEEENKTEEKTESEKKPESNLASGELTEEDYALIKTKRRVLGNMKFIGELFIASVIPPKIMHSVVQELLANTDDPEEEEVECVCRLLITVGAAIDTPDQTAMWTKYMERLRSLSTNNKLPTRVRFMVMDILELRQNKWRKTLPAHPVARPSSASSGTNIRASDRERPTIQQRPPSTGAIKYVSTAARNQDVRYERSGNKDNDDFRTCGVRGASSTQGRNVYTRSGARAQTQQDNQQQSKLQEESSSLRNSKSSLPSQESLNRYHALDLDDDKAASAEESLIGEDFLVPDQRQHQDLSSVDEKQLSRICSTLDESLGQKNYDDVTLAMLELPVSHRSAALRALILHAFDKGCKHIDLLVEVIFPSFLAKEDLSSPSIVEAGLKGAFEMLDDLVVDIPNALKFAGQISAVFFDAKLLTLTTLVQSTLACVSDRNPSCAGKVVLYTIAASKQGASDKQESIRASRPELEPCVFAENVRESLKPTIEKLALLDLLT